MHLCMFLSPVDSFLGRSEIFGLSLANADLLGLGRQGGLSYHIYPDVSTTVCYISSVGFFIFAWCVSNTLEFWKTIEDSAPFLGVPFSIFFSWHFL